MYEKLTKCQNFTWYLPEKYFPEFWEARATPWPPVSYAYLGYRRYRVNKVSRFGNSKNVAAVQRIGTHIYFYKQRSWQIGDLAGQFAMRAQRRPPDVGYFYSSGVAACAKSHVFANN